ncbi:MAG: GAF domain-containing protein [Acidobacteriota bacterium]
MSTSCEFIGELVRLTASPASKEEICSQGVCLTAEALGAQGALLLVRDDPDAEPEVASSWGTIPGAEARQAALAALRSGEPAVAPGAGNRRPSRVVALLPGQTGALGALVLERPGRWSRRMQGALSTAARTIAAALQAERRFQGSRRQGEALAKRNVELETLREIGLRLQRLDSEEEILQAALDIVLERLGLDAGWIFWGEASRGRLELAVSRGISDEFVRRAGESGIGRCLCQDVFATGSFRVARNTTDCPRMPELVRTPGSSAHACIPLKFERGVFGVMNIANRPGQLFTPEELQFLETAGHQICLAIDKIRTTQAEARKNAEAQALASLAHGIGGSLDLEKVLAAVGDYARDLLTADRCAIYLGEDPSRLEFAYLTGPPIEGLETGRIVDFVSLGSRALVQTLRRQQTMVIRDVTEDPRVNVDLALRWRSMSAIIVPLSARDRPQGLLVADRHRPSDWSPGEISLAGALGGQAAVAIDNARLYREAQEAYIRLHKAQYDMMQSERMAAIGTLASSLAHEVRNPLNSISLQMVLLSRRMARIERPAQAEIAELVETMRREIDRLNDLVGEFLSLSSVDRLSRRNWDPEDVAREVVMLMAPVAREKGIRLTQELAGCLPRIPLDHEKIKQVLINLVRNAIEAMPNGGLLTVSSRRSNRSVVLGVADTGVGIQPDLDVFDFFTTTKSGGTGLGLPIARRIVEAHGGSLTYESRPGRGSTFLVTLEVPQEAEAAEGGAGKPR